MARPKLEIDEETVFKLASIQCSYEEMADVLNCDPSTLTRRFAQVIKEGRSQGKTSLKRKQFEVAMTGNTSMLIWLGKQILGQTDKSDIKLSQISDEELVAEAKARLAKNGAES